MNTHRKIRDAPSGSAGSPGVKWQLYDCASFLLDARLDEISTQSSYELASTQNVSFDNFRNAVSFRLLTELQY